MPIGGIHTELGIFNLHLGLKFKESFWKRMKNPNSQSPTNNWDFSACTICFCLQANLSLFGKLPNLIRLLNKHEFKFDTSTVPLVHVYLTLLCNILCNILSSICLFLSKGHHTQISNVSKVKGKEGKRPDLEKMRSKTTRIKKLTTTILT